MEICKASGIWIPRNDIALIFLDEDLSDIDKLCTVRLPTSRCDGDSHEALQVIGYGADIESGPVTDTLEYTDLICITHDECEDRFGNYRGYVYDECDGIFTGDCAKDYDPDYDYNDDFPNATWWYLDEETMQCAAGDVLLPVMEIVVVHSSKQVQICNMVSPHGLWM